MIGSESDVVEEIQFFLDFIFSILIQLVELEEKLKEETKGRDRAQKRLKSLMKKLESLKIVYSSHSSSFGKSDLSVSSSLSLSSSSASSFSYPNREPDVNDMKKPNSPLRKSLKCELKKPVIKNGSTVAETLDHSDIDNASTENHSLLSNDKISTDKTICEDSYDELRCTQLSDNIKRDDHRYVTAKPIFCSVSLEVLHF